MKINISRLLKNETMTFTGLVLEDNKEELQRFSAVINKATVVVNLTKLSKNILAEGEIDAEISGACVRCNNKGQEKLKILFSEMFYHTSEDIKEDGFVYSGNVLDLEPLVLEYIMLNFSGRILCNENCKGLCPNCGKNLNEGSCNCSLDKDGLVNPANPMLKLAKLKRKLK